MKRPSLLSQVLAINVLLIVATVLVTGVLGHLSLADLSQHGGIVVLGLAIAASLLANWLLLRRRFAGLHKLIATMEQVDLAAPGARAQVAPGDARDVVRLHAAFNRMVGRLEAERRQAAHAVLQAQEQERQRIAQDLHDEVNQALTAIVLRLEATTQSAPSALRRELQETKRLANQAMDELLRLARELRPTALDDHGLIPALHTQVRDFAERTGIDARFHRRGPMPRLRDDQQLVVYRVTQESLSNIAQHADATRVDVELSFVGRTLLRVRDNGRGFVETRNGGLGLSGMRERALLVGARLAVRSIKGHGTDVELTLD